MKKECLFYFLNFSFSTSPRTESKYSPAWKLDKADWFPVFGSFGCVYPKTMCDHSSVKRIFLIFSKLKNLLYRILYVESFFLVPFEESLLNIFKLHKCSPWFQFSVTDKPDSYCQMFLKCIVEIIFCLSVGTRV